jgi:hypothetical protein
MRRVQVLFLLALGFLPAYAQQPAAETPEQIEIKHRAELLQALQQLDVQKLIGLSEFQDYVKVTQELNTLPEKYKAAAAKPSPVKPLSKQDH